MTAWKDLMLKTTTTTTVFAIAVGALGLWWIWSSSKQAKRRKKVYDDTDPIHCKRCRLTSEEQGYLAVGLAPVTTGTWVLMNDNESLKLLETRLRERILKIVQANPYLMGCFVRDATQENSPYCIEYNTTYTPTLQDIEPLLQTAVVDGIHPAMPYTEMVEACLPYMLQQHQDKQQPVWKVVILRPAAAAKVHDDSSKVLILVSMSHVSGDGYTYYVLWNMLLGGDPIRSLQVERLANLNPLQEAALGKTEAHLTSSLGFILSSVRGLIMNKLANVLGWNQLQCKERILLVDPEKLDQIKHQAVKDKDASSALSSSSTTTTSSSFVSTNDILTSWFFKSTHSAHCIMAMNMRQRIPELTWDMAGNYPSVLYFRPPDVQHPTLIRTAVQTLCRAVTSHQPLQPLREMTFSNVSFVTNWATFCHMNHLSDAAAAAAAAGNANDEALPIQKILLHLPLLFFRDTFASTIAMGIVFRARPDRIGMLLAGTPAKMKDTKQAPFESTIQNETSFLPGGAASSASS